MEVENIFQQHLLQLRKRNLSDIFLEIVSFTYFFICLDDVNHKLTSLSDNRSNADSTSHTDGASTPDVVSAKILFNDLNIFV